MGNQLREIKRVKINDDYVIVVLEKSSTHWSTIGSPPFSISINRVTPRMEGELQEYVEVNSYASFSTIEQADAYINKLLAFVKVHEIGPETEFKF